jgi:hypothetical protein
MGTDLRYALINSFRSIDALRANQAFNLLGSFVPGFRPRDISLGLIATDLNLTSSEPPVKRAASGTTGPARGRGTRSGATVTDYELSVLGYRQSTATAKPTRTQGTTQIPTNLSIIGDGFFAVSDGLTPNARVFLTRNGRFKWQAVGTDNGAPIYRLVNDQGLFVLRAEDIQINKATGRPELKPDKPLDKFGKTDPLGRGMAMSKNSPRDGAFQDLNLTTPGRIFGVIGESVKGNMTEVTDEALPSFFVRPDDNRSAIAIVKVPLAGELVNSSFGPEVYTLPPAGGRGLLIDSLEGWYIREKGNGPKVLPDSLELIDQKALQDRIVIDNEAANFVYRTLSNFLTDYNKSIDDLLGIIR